MRRKLSFIGLIIILIQYRAVAQTLTKIVSGNDVSGTFLDIYALAVDDNDNVFLGSDYDLIKVSKAGAVSNLGKFTHIRSICMGAGESVIVANSYDHIVEKVEPNGHISIIAGIPVEKESFLGSPNNRDDGPATEHEFWLIWNVSADDGGNVYFTEGANKWKVDASGSLSKVDASVLDNFTVKDKKGNFYIIGQGVDAVNTALGNYDNVVTKIGADGSQAIIAGGGTDKLDGVPATSVHLAKIGAIAVDNDGNLFLTECNGDKDNPPRIRKVDENGIITTVAGGGKLGMGYINKVGIKATSVMLPNVHHMVFNKAGDLYFSCGAIIDGDYNVFKLNMSASQSPPIPITQVTTLDAKSVTVYLDRTKAATEQRVSFQVYRSAESFINSSSISIGKPEKITITPNENTVTLLKGTPLTPDTRMPYIIVEESSGGQKTTAYFKKWMLGAVSHGFDRWALDSPFWLDDTNFKTDHPYQSFWLNKMKMINTTLFKGCQDFSLPNWEIDMAHKLKEIDKYDDVISFNWMEDCAIANHEMALVAGTKLFNQIVTWVAMHSKHPGDVTDLHLIGHSRGSVVVTKALNLLFEKNQNHDHSFDGSYIALTLLDPHPANNDLEPKISTNPSGTSWGSWGRDLEGNSDCVEHEIQISTECIAKTIAILNAKANTPLNESDQKAMYDALLQNGDCTNTDGQRQSMCSMFVGILSSLFKDFISCKANESTTTFQGMVHDDKLVIPPIVQKIEILFQHTRANKLCGQHDQEFVQNLWGMVSPTTVAWLNSNVELNYHDLTDNDIDGIGVIGHNQVPLVYEQLWVDTGTLNRSKPTEKQN